MLRLWRWYQKCLNVHPVKTQVISSGFLWGLGDIGAQAITHQSALRKNLTVNNMDSSDRVRNLYCVIQPGYTPIFDTIFIIKDETGSLLFNKVWSKQLAGQSYQDEKEFKINWQRVATTSMFGFAFVGPVGHYWYEYLDRYIRLRLHLQPKTFKFVATKVAADGLLFGPLDLIVFFSYMGLASGRSIEQVKQDVKRDFLPSLIVAGTVWPAVQVANFRYVPVRYQLLYVNFFCLLDSSFLSWIEQQGDATWKQWFSSHKNLK